MPDALPGRSGAPVGVLVIGSFLAACGGDPSGPGPTGGLGGPFSQPRSVVFASDRDGDFDIYAMYEDGSDVVQLTNLPGDEQRPRWSPDGEWIAFDHSTSSIYRMRGDGTDLEELWGGLAPAWSPDGDEIAYSGGSTLKVRRIDGSEERTLASNPLGIDGLDWGAGGRIAFTIGVDGSVGFTGLQLRLIDAGGGEHTFLANGVNPRWSQDGTRLAATWVSPLSVVSLAIWDIGASGDPALVIPLFAAGPPAWSSDGSELIVSFADDIHRVGVDGGAQVQLTTHPARDWDPDWR